MSAAQAFSWQHPTTFGNMSGWKVYFYRVLLSRDSPEEDVVASVQEDVWDIESDEGW